MSRGRHPKSAVAAALDQAEKKGFRIDEDHNGYRWGWVTCPICSHAFTISITPRNPSSHGKQIDFFLATHAHENAQGGAHS